MIRPVCQQGKTKFAKEIFAVTDDRKKARSLSVQGRVKRVNSYD